MGTRRTALGATVAVLLLAGAGTARAAGDPQVAALQVALRAAGTYSGSVDGLAGPATRAGTVAVQRRRGLVADGVAGPATRRALGRAGRSAGGVLRVGRSGWDVAALQFALAIHGFPSGPVDGGYGARTAAAVQRFQAYATLGADGVAGPATRRALRGPPPRSVLRFAPPARGLIGDTFGPRGTGFHPGVDYPLPYGATVRAAGRGCVVSAGFRSDGYGNRVVLRHRAGMTSLYAHLQRVSVGVGRCLTAGVQIGTVGSSGFSSGPHLHFELRLRGAAVDPRSGL
jgi:murein DD-endopeptidase MepM/ murein hydrolase activator NlpD